MSFKLSDYIEDVKSALRDGLSHERGNPPAVIDGPVEFALNSYHEKEFVCVAERTMAPEYLDSVDQYRMPIEVEIGIFVERAPSDRTSNHLVRARKIFDDVWHALANMTVSNHQIIRASAEREETEDASAVAYTILCNHQIFARDNAC